MDPEPGAHLLINRWIPLLGIVLWAIPGCGGGDGPPPPSLPALALATTVLRLPAGGGGVIAYRSDSLLPGGWASAAVTAVTRPLGYDIDQRIVYFLDRRDRLTALDMEAGNSRPMVEGVRVATVGPDGAAFVVDSLGRLIRVSRRTFTTFRQRFTSPPLALFGTLGGQVIALTRDSVTRLQLHSPEQVSDGVTLEPGPVTATIWGEVVSASSRKGVRLIRLSDARGERTLALSDAPIDEAFSPSGHRLYVLTDADQLLVFNRFSGSRIHTVDLPGSARQIRPDPSGRWMLIRPVAADSVWVLDLATLSPSILSYPSTWGVTLPLVAGAATLLTAEGLDVVGRDLSVSRSAPISVVVGGAEDTWLAVPWVPAQQAQAVLAAAESASAVQDSSLQILPTQGTPAGPGFYLQVSSSQSEVWARDLANQLSASGLPTVVWSPAGPDEGYRVVIGPYPSRDEAEETGRRVGRPYFIVTAPSPGRR
ncbi:MAG: SPOR domain-containing protein [Gemmatimonadota bacterium]